MSFRTAVAVAVLGFGFAAAIYFDVARSIDRALTELGRS